MLFEHVDNLTSYGRRLVDENCNSIAYFSCLIRHGRARRLRGGGKLGDILARHTDYHRTFRGKRLVGIQGGRSDTMSISV